MSEESAVPRISCNLSNHKINWLDLRTTALKVDDWAWRSGNKKSHLFSNAAHVRHVFSFDTLIRLLLSYMNFPKPQTSHSLAIQCLSNIYRNKKLSQNAESILPHTLRSLWITCFWWQYCTADTIYNREETSSFRELLLLLEMQGLRNVTIK